MEKNLLVIGEHEIDVIPVFQSIGLPEQFQM